MNKIIIFSAAALMAFAMACGNKKASGPLHVKQEMETSENQVVLNEAQMKAINLQTGKISQQSITNAVHASGYVDVPPSGKAVVSPLVPGYVRQIKYLVGNEVKKGAVMAVLESMEYVELQQQYAGLRARIEFLKDEYDRQQTLQAQNATAAKKMLLAGSEYKSARSNLNGVGEKLRMAGADMEKLDAGTISSQMVLKAPIGGAVTHVTATVGKHVDPQEEIFEIINPEHKHLELEVFEKDITKVQKGQAVLFTIPNNGTGQFHGTVFLVGQSLEPNKRYVKVHVHPAEEDESKFKVGMYVKASIATGSHTADALPVGAVVVQGGRQYVFVEKGEKDGNRVFEKMPVITGEESQGLVEIKLHEGITEADNVVVQGAFYLLNAFAVSGHEH